MLLFEHSKLWDFMLVYDGRTCPALQGYRGTKTSKSVLSLQLDFMVKSEATKDSRFTHSTDKYLLNTPGGKKDGFIPAAASS